MTKRGQLTDSGLRSKNKAPGYYLDGHGLYLQVSKSGSRSWLLRYTLNGRTREMGLGSLDDFGLAQARDRAQSARRLIADGIDPIERRREERHTSRLAQQERENRSVTFEQCAREYHTASGDEWRNAKHAAQWITTLEKYAFPKFGKVPVSDVTKSQVVASLQPIWKSKAETASRVLQRIRTTLNYAAAKDYCKGHDGEFWEQVKIALGPNEKARKVEHHSACPYDLVSALIQRVQQSTASESVRLAVEFTILTAARSGETRGALISEIDHKSRVWKIPAERMKAARAHSVPLSERAYAIVERAAVMREQGLVHSDLKLLFPNASGLPLSDMAFTQLLRRLDVPYTMHGFRATFRTWGSEQTQYEHEMLEFALAHAVGDNTVRAYMRTDMLEKRRQLMQDWAQHCAGESAKVPKK